MPARQDSWEFVVARCLVGLVVLDVDRDGAAFIPHHYGCAMKHMHVDGMGQSWDGQGHKCSKTVFAMHAAADALVLAKLKDARQGAWNVYMALTL